MNEVYKRKNMLKALETIHVPGDFLLTNYVRKTPILHDTELIEIDLVREGKKMAPFVSPVREGVVITKEGMTTLYHKLPYIKIKDTFTAEEVANRRAGSTVYDGMTPQKYINKEMGKTLRKFDKMIFRREEWMASRMLQTGKIVVSGEGIEYEIDVNMKATHLPVLGAGDRWDEATAEIQTNLSDWAELNYDDSGDVSTDAILGRLASKAMLSNDTFIGSLDRRRIDRGEIKIEKLPKGVKYFGFDRESGLNLYGYTEKFFNGTVMEDLIDPKKVVICSRNMRFERHYGFIHDVETDFIGPRWPKSWVTEDPSARWVMLQSAPAVILHEPDAVTCATVLA